MHSARSCMIHHGTDVPPTSCCSADQREPCKLRSKPQRRRTCDAAGHLDEDVGGGGEAHREGPPGKELQKRLSAARTLQGAWSPAQPSASSAAPLAASHLLECPSDGGRRRLARNSVQRKLGHRALPAAAAGKGFGSRWIAHDSRVPIWRPGGGVWRLLPAAAGLSM